MSSKQLDILCLEPFFGGVRRAMLETVVKCSRHRWTVLRLPPRRIERRLTTAANWFSEQLSRHWVGRVDVLFTSEAMNLAQLLRLTPELAHHPSVVYFHDNQLPDLSLGEERDTDLVNLNTAMSATETWFNSAYHRQTFLIRAKALVEKHHELSGRDPMSQLSAHSRLMPPPVDWAVVDEVRQMYPQLRRNPRTVFIETRDASMPLLNEALSIVRRGGTSINAITVGPVNDLDPALPRYTVSEYDVIGQVKGMLESSVFVSARPDAASDYLAVRAMIAGCRPVLPDAGTYPEILPRELHEKCLYPIYPEGLAGLIEQALTDASDGWSYDGFRPAFKPFEPISVCRGFDDRLVQLVQDHETRKARRS